jgi:hypothetical protein
VEHRYSDFAAHQLNLVEVLSVSAAKMLTNPVKVNSIPGTE